MEPLKSNWDDEDLDDDDVKESWEDEEQPAKVCTCIIPLLLSLIFLVC